MTKKTAPKTPKKPLSSANRKKPAKAPKISAEPLPEVSARQGGLPDPLDPSSGAEKAKAGRGRRRKTREELEEALKERPDDVTRDVMALAEYDVGDVSDGDSWKTFLNCIAALPSRKQAFEKSGLSRWQVHQRLTDDRAFAARFLEAWEMGVDALEDEAVRRAVLGWYEPVFSQGMYVGEVLRYSDSLLATLLKANRRKFRGDDANAQRGLSEESKSQLQQVFARAMAEIG